MFDLGFSKDNRESQNLCEEVWNLVSEDNHAVTYANARVVFSGILNFNFPWMKPKKDDSEPKSKQRGGQHLSLFL